MDPERMAQVARALARRLASLEPGAATRFQSAAEQFASAVAGRLPEWRKRVGGAPGALLYHKDVNYLMTLLGLPVLGYIEPIPGVPPTAQHLRDLVQRLRSRRGAVLYTTAQSSQGPLFVGKELGWKVTQLPLEPPLSATSDDYFALIDRWVAALAGAKP